MSGPEASPERRMPYTSFGDTIPSPDQLRHLLQANSKADNLFMASLRGDIYLDLARTELAASEKWLGRAMASRRQVGALALESSVTGDKDGDISMLVHSYLMQADMPNWHRAIRSQRLRTEYRQKLTAAEKALPFLLPSGYDLISTRLMEFVPLLLGARGLHNNYVHGWLGRSALLREESRTGVEDPSKNFNWDTGIVLGCSADEFLSPTVRLSVKKRFRARGMNYKDSSGFYRRAGILPISATEHGFADPKKVVASCLEEAGVEQRFYGSECLMDSERLNEITDGLYKKFKQHAAHLAEGPSDD